MAFFLLPHLSTQNNKSWLPSLGRISVKTKRNDKKWTDVWMNTCIASCVLDQVAAGRWNNSTMKLLLTSTKPGWGEIAWLRKFLKMVILLKLRILQFDLLSQLDSVGDFKKYRELQNAPLFTWRPVLPGAGPGSGNFTQSRLHWSRLEL